jgi:hypothetical protein
MFFHLVRQDNFATPESGVPEVRGFRRREKTREILASETRHRAYDVITLPMLDLRHAPVLIFI